MTSGRIEIDGVTVHNTNGTCIVTNHSDKSVTVLRDGTTRLDAVVPLPDGATVVAPGQFYTFRTATGAHVSGGSAVEAPAQSARVKLCTPPHGGGGGSMTFHAPNGIASNGAVRNFTVGGLQASPQTTTMVGTALFTPQLPRSVGARAASIPRRIQTNMDRVSVYAPYGVAAACVSNGRIETRREDGTVDVITVNTRPPSPRNNRDSASSSDRERDRSPT